jgi:hypothetical protein
VGSCSAIATCFRSWSCVNWRDVAEVSTKFAFATVVTEEGRGRHAYIGVSGVLRVAEGCFFGYYQRYHFLLVVSMKPRSIEVLRVIDRERNARGLIFGFSLVTPPPPRHDPAK